jgi:hypothetical protein
MDSEERKIQIFHYNETINAIKSQFFSALDDFQKYYVFYHKNPEVESYQLNFEKSKIQLQNSNNQLTQLTCNINNIIQTLDLDMEEVVKMLEAERLLNIKLTNTLNDLETTQNGSETLIDDYKEKYNEQYYKNFQLYVGIILIMFVLAKLSLNPLFITMLKVLIFLTIIVLIYSLSITYTFIVFFMFIVILVGIFSFWKRNNS